MLMSSPSDITSGTLRVKVIPGMKQTFKVANQNKESFS